MVVLVVLATSVPTAQAEVCNEKPCITVTPCLTAGFSNQLNLLSQSKEKIEYKKKYVKGTYVNIREQPSKNSEVIKQVSFNEQVIIIGNELTNGCWYTVDLDDKTGYIHKDYVSDKPINYRIYNVPCVKNKTWMPYMSCRSLADALYDKDNFVTVQVGDREYYIKTVKQKRTHANLDDSVMHTVLVCEE